MITSAFLSLFLSNVLLTGREMGENFYVMEVFVASIVFFDVVPIVVILKNEKMTAFVLNRLGESAAFKMVFEVVGLAKKALLEWRKSGNKVVDIQMNKI